MICNKLGKIGFVFLISVFTLFILINNLNTIEANGLNINSFLVRSDSSDSFLNIQYGNYYDNIDLQVNFGLNNLNGYSAVPVVLSPRLYGINNYGNTVLLDVLPSVNYNVYNTNPETYMYNNLFYVRPDYDSYMVMMNINSVDNSYSASELAYIYVDQTINPEHYIPDYGEEDDDFEDNINESVDDFYLSGQQHIYLDEDDSEDHKIYVNNLSNKTLNIVAVQTSTPTRLDIDDIDYPSFINPNSSDYINIELTSNSVSSNYTGEFNVYIIARYGNSADIEKQVTIVYNISDEDVTSYADCDDLDLENYRFTISDNSITLKEILLENNSDDYYFEIDSIEVEDNSLINTRIVDFDDFIDEEETGFINLEFTSDDITSQSRENIELEIKGYFKRNNTSEKRCTIREDLRITIENNYNSNNNNTNNTNITNCNNIKIFAPNIIQEENTIKNYNKNKGFFLLNNSNKDFTINNIIVSDNTSFANVTKNTIENKIYARSDLSLNFDISTKEINNFSNTSNASISVIGTFSDGTICNSGDLREYFVLEVVDSNDKCSKVGINSRIVNSGENLITLFNNTNETFYVEDFLELNKYNLESNIFEDQTTITSNSTKDISVGFVGSGTMQIALSGRFSDGTTCNFNETQVGTFNSANIDTYHFSNNINNSCSSQLSAPSFLELSDATKTYSLSFINESSKGGKIIISGNGAISNPSIIYLDGHDNFSKEITISNFSNPKSIFYKVILNGCESDLYFTNLEEKINVSDRIQFISYPTTIKPSSRNVQVALQIQNSYNTSKEVEIKLSGFPNTWKTNSKTLLIEPRTIVDSYLGIVIVDDEYKKQYNGYVDLYKDNVIIHSIPLTIDLSDNTQEVFLEGVISKDPSLKNTYLVNLYLENNSSFSKDYIVDFNLNDDFIIQGETNIFLLADSNKSLDYKIVSPYILEDGFKINLKLKDKLNSSEIITEDIIFIKEKQSYLTGFLVFTNNVADIILILIVIALLVLTIKKLRLIYLKKKNKTYTCNTLITENQNKKIVDY